MNKLVQMCKSGQHDLNTSHSYLHVDPSHKNGVGSHFALRQNVAIWQLGWKLVAELRLVVILQENYALIFLGPAKKTW